jgi:hypothetical protein
MVRCTFISRSVLAQPRKEVGSGSCYGTAEERSGLQRVHVSLASQSICLFIGTDSERELINLPSSFLDRLRQRRMRARPFSGRQQQQLCSRPSIFEVSDRLGLLLIHIYWFNCFTLQYDLCFTLLSLSRTHRKKTSFSKFYSKRTTRDMLICVG